MRLKLSLGLAKRGIQSIISTISGNRITADSNNRVTADGNNRVSAGE